VEEELEWELGVSGDPRPDGKPEMGDLRLGLVP